MVVSKVQPDGHVQLPDEIQQALGIEPGDLVSLDMTGPGTVEIRRLPRLTLAVALDRYRIDGPIGDAAAWEEWKEVAARDLFGADEDA